MTWNAIAQNIYLDSKSDQIIALGQTVGKRRWAGISCNVLPANRFSHKLCSPSLEQGQVSAIQDPIHPSSVNHNQMRLSFFLLPTFTQLLICLCWYLWVKIAKQLQLNRGCLTQELLCPEQSGSYVLTWIEEKKQSTFEDPLDQRQEQRCSWQLPFVSLVVGNSLYRARHISER